MKNILINKIPFQKTLPKKKIGVVTCSRNEIEKISQNQFENHIALISITDIGRNPVELKNSPKFFLRLSFDDIDFHELSLANRNELSAQEKESLEEDYGVITVDQAIKIADFYNRICSDGVTTVICQCEFGQSRSAGVKAALLEYEYQNGISVFSDKNLCPNKLVFKRVLKALIMKKSTKKQRRLLPLTLE